VELKAIELKVEASHISLQCPINQTDMGLDIILLWKNLLFQ